jgi:quercetin dioxygenase-like cupin family protein
MRQFAVALSFVVVALLGGVGGWGMPPAMFAQEATPAADEAGMEGLSFTLLGLAQAPSLPSPAALEVARVGFEPGAGFPFYSSDPTAVIVIVESGTLTARVEEQAWTISRGSALQAMMATPAAAPDLSGVLEEVAMGAEGMLEAGDVAYIPGNLSGEVRNAGQEPVSALVILIAPADAPMGDAAEGTPAA